MRKTPAFVMLAVGGVLMLQADTDRGVGLYLEGKYSEAQSELAKAVETNPDDARAHRYLGLALVEQHKPAEAQEHITKSNELEANGESKVALARLYIEQKELDKADEALQDADGAERDYVRGLLQFQRGQHQEAAESLERYIKDHPEHPYAHYYAGLAYNGLKRPDKMLTHFEMFVKLKPDAPEAKKVRAVLSTGR